MSKYHTAVLLQEVLEYLQVREGGIYVDATIGGGGHAEAILEHLGTSGRVIGFDQDAEAIAHTRRRLERFGHQVIFVHDNLTSLALHLSRLDIPRVNGILFDLGVSSHQIDSPHRGFSFQIEGPIDMRMNQDKHPDGATVLNTYSRERLASIFREFGEERNAGRIASAIVRHRQTRQLSTTTELRDIVESVSGKQFLVKSLARIFQALRIEVNEELKNLASGLRTAVEHLAAGGRIVVISYHSLEDRIVKDCFREEARTSIPSAHRLIPDQPVEPRLRILTKKPMGAGGEESHINPRARSAKLRAAERIG